MKKIIFPIIVLAGFSLFYSCDKVDNPIPITDDGPELSDSLVFDTTFAESNNTIRKIVLEEFTGHTCSQCPTGAVKIEDLVTTYGSQLIPVSIHAGFFSEPQIGTGKYGSDYRTDIGNAFQNTFNPQSYPAGMVSRVEHTNGSKVNGKDIWDPIIQTIVNDVPKVKISITNLYNESSRAIKEIISTEWLSTESSNYKLQVYVIEDHIIDWQKDGSNDIAAYDHRHVLRKALNSDFGTAIPSSNQGDIDTQEFTFEIPDEWNVDNCMIVALVYDVTTDEILQGEEVYIKKP